MQVVAFQASKQAPERAEETRAAWDAHHTWRRYMLLACNSVLSSHAGTYEWSFADTCACVV